MARVALIGANGQLGTDITRLWADSALGKRGDELIGLTHADIEVTDPAFVRSVLTGVQPSIVINTAAYHNVDECESNPLEAFEVNALGVKYVAEVCRDLAPRSCSSATTACSTAPRARPTQRTTLWADQRLRHLRGGRRALPALHAARRPPARAQRWPLRRRRCERQGRQLRRDHAALCREGRPIRVVDDQITSPTYTLDLADVLLEVIAREVRGTLHITNAGECSWYEFASEVFSLLGVHPDFAAIGTEEAMDAAPRPAYSVLDNARLEFLGLQQPRDWREALMDYLKLKGRLAA